MAHLRIIVLAEAGSGKSEELEDQARSLCSEGKPVFHLTVQELAKDGLAGALTNAAISNAQALRTFSFI